MKTGRAIFILSLTMVLCLGVMGTGIAAGRNGNGKGNGVGGVGAKLGNGTGICIASDMVTAPEKSIEGTVYSVGNYGQGLVIDTETGLVTVFGIGPVRYWEDVLEVARPDVGDKIIVTGREVTFSDGTTKIIAFTITFVEDPDETIVLRDEETGLPLWRGDGFKRQHRYMERNQIGDDTSGL